MISGTPTAPLPARLGLSDTLAPWIPHWPVIAAIVIMAVPTFATLGKQVWSTEAGAHAPIVLATGLWLLLRRDDRVAPGGRIQPAIIALMLMLALPFYIFGHAYDFISLETLGLYLVFLTLYYSVCGIDSVRAHLFPLLYLGFVIPLPGWFVQAVTQPLQNFLSYSATEMLQAFGYPIARQGVTLFIAQYQLLVEDACAGMNSLVGLIAVSLFYIYVMHRATLRYAAFLLLLIIPVAILVNLIRITLLILVTYYFGDAAAQGFLHVTTGLVLFLLAVSIIFGVDQAIMTFAHRRQARA